MASIRIETIVAASPEKVWDALRDVGAVHTRQARGFVTDCRLEEGARIVTFANGFVARELIVDIDDKNRRVAYAVTGSESLSHHSASFQVLKTAARHASSGLPTSCPTAPSPPFAA
jgi:hypothetical protein